MALAQKERALDSIDNLLRSLSKAAETSHTEAGGYAGETEHPVKKEDDGTEEASTGSRARENEQDIKEDQGEPAVDGEATKESRSKKSMPTDQDSVQLNIGTKQRATGEDAENETGKAKGGKEDGGYQGASSHPARTDNDQIDGHKWAGQIKNLLALTKTAEDKCNDLLGAISVAADGDIRKRASAMQGEAAATPADGKQAAAKTQDPGKSATAQNNGKQAGAELAQTLLEGQVSGQDKQAELYQVVEDLAETIAMSWRMADKTAAFLNGVRDAQKKANEDRGYENGEKEEGSENPPEREESSEKPPQESNGGSGGGEPSDEDLLAALTGGDAGAGSGMGAPLGDMGGGAPSMDAMGGGAAPGGAPGGGMPPAPGGAVGGAPGGAMGGDPLAGGGAPGGDPLGGMGGQLSPEDLAMLLQILQQTGISPDQLQAGAEAKVAQALALGAKQAQARTNGKAADLQQWRPKNAAEAQRFQSMLKTVKEIAAVGTAA